MIKRIIQIAILISFIIVAGGFYFSNLEGGITIFPKGDNSWVGDPMPYYDGKVFRVFYLEDLRNGDVGYHPWSLLSTENFYEYKSDGVVIPYSKNTFDQDNALGTGSVIRDKAGVYHAFYTGHNSGKQKTEAIMHATSKDMKTWVKVPNDTFYADEQYSKDDFRDPYVLYNEENKQYWMLITTRKANMGVIARYTSKDLVKWTNEGVLFSNDMGSDSNMECSSLIKYGDYWYLSFSDQWPNRVVHYRIAASLRGPFRKPKQDVFDGNGFYAGRLEKDTKNLFIFGWTPTKVNYDDNMNYDWAGNLVVHQLKQKSNGELYVVPVENIINKIDTREWSKILFLNNTIKNNKLGYQFLGKGFEKMSFKELQGVKKITGEIDVKTKADKFGFMFGIYKDGTSTLNIVFNCKENKLEFYNVPINDIKNMQPQSIVPLSMKGQKKFKFTILLDDSVGVIYVNDQVALSTRMFGLQKHSWGVFSMNSDIMLKNLVISDSK